MISDNSSRRQLDELTATLLRMASAVDEMLGMALRAFLQRDPDMARDVLDRDDAVDALDNVVDEMCLRLLALEQPVAADLRYVVAAMRLTGELERVADEACNVADHTVDMCAIPPTVPHPVMRAFADHSLTMFRSAVEAFRTRDPELARKICALEEKADDLHMRAVRTCFAELTGEEQSAQISLFRIFIARSLERVCDLATNICEQTVFAVEGSVIKHKWQCAERPGPQN